MTHMTLALFDEFDAAEVAAIESAIQADKLADGQARAMRRQGRIHARRLLAEQHLAEILPATLDEGESLHVISHGDVDSLTYLRYVLTFGPADHVLLSTWCMARPDIEELREHLAASRIRTLDWYVGEIFPSQYGDEFALVQQIVDEHGGRCCVAKNHSKVMAIKAAGHYVIESSANLNTNPRIEQTAITRCEDLYWFYRDFFDGLRSIDRGR
jgi:hypothetical protein